MAAESPKAWFKWLKDNGCKKLKLGFKPGNSKYFEDYQIVGHGESGVWYIEAVYDDHSNYWVSKWQVAEIDVKFSTSWSITYRRIDLDISDECTCNLDDIKKDFLSAIDGVIKFAEKADAAGWIKTFKKAASELDSETPSFYEYDSDLLVRKNYSHEALQVITAAAKAWVFGGMGNWSDNYYGKELNDEHHRVTKVLFNAVCKALICGVNSFPS